MKKEAKRKMNKNVVLLVENCSFNFIYIHLTPRFQAWQREQASKRVEQSKQASKKFIFPCNISFFSKIKWKIYNDVGFWFFFLIIMRILILLPSQLASQYILFEFLFIRNNWVFMSNKPRYKMTCSSSSTSLSSWIWFFTLIHIQYIVQST